MITYKYTSVENISVYIVSDGVVTGSCLASTLPEGAVIEAYVPTPAELNAPILAELDRLDKALIRPMSEGETERVAEIVAQKQVLRSQLCH